MKKRKILALLLSGVLSMTLLGGCLDDELDEELKSDARIYQGYLAMCEEYILAGITPSGFSTQDGITWTVDQVAPGIRYFHASGTVTPTWMDGGKHRQSLYVVDYDLSNPDYEVKIVHCSPPVSCRKYSRPQAQWRPSMPAMRSHLLP